MFWVYTLKIGFWPTLSDLRWVLRCALILIIKNAKAQMISWISWRSSMAMSPWVVSRLELCEFKDLRWSSSGIGWWISSGSFWSLWIRATGRQGPCWSRLISCFSFRSGESLRGEVHLLSTRPLRWWLGLMGWEIMMKSRSESYLWVVHVVSCCFACVLEMIWFTIWFTWFCWSCGRLSTWS